MLRLVRLVLTYFSLPLFRFTERTGGHQGRGGRAGGERLGLRDRPVPLLDAAAAEARALQLPAHEQPRVLHVLQEHPYVADHVLVQLPLRLLRRENVHGGRHPVLQPVLHLHPDPAVRHLRQGRGRGGRARLPGPLRRRHPQRVLQRTTAAVSSTGPISLY
jgi:hypothetical protein